MSIATGRSLRFGVCEARGVSQCRQGQESKCVLHCALGRDVTCDGADDDCDGQLDEAAPEQRIECGEGACQRVGASSCVNGDYQEAQSRDSLTMMMQSVMVSTRTATV